MEKTILFVDDEVLYQKLFGDALKAAGYHVIFANNGQEALERIAEGKPDLLIVDCIMPIMTGMSLLKKLRRRRIPSIVLTTLEGETDREDAFALDVKEFLTKSTIDPNILVAKVGNIFAS